LSLRTASRYGCAHQDIDGVVSPLNDGVAPVLAAVHRSSTSRGHAARETQIILVVPAAFSSSVSGSARWSTSPGSIYVSQVPQIPTVHEEGAPAARTASVCSDTTSTTRPVRELHHKRYGCRGAGPRQRPEAFDV